MYKAGDIIGKYRIIALQQQCKATRRGWLKDFFSQTYEYRYRYLAQNIATKDLYWMGEEDLC